MGGVGDFSYHGNVGTGKKRVYLHTIIRRLPRRFCIFSNRPRCLSLTDRSGWLRCNAQVEYDGFCAGITLYSGVRYTLYPIHRQFIFCKGMINKN